MIQIEPTGQRLYCLKQGYNYGWECVGLMCEYFWECKQRQGNNSEEKGAKNDSQDK